jgi:Ribbon-helix-helix domain
LRPTLFTRCTSGCTDRPLAFIIGGAKAADFLTGNQTCSFMSLQVESHLLQQKDTQVHDTGVLFPKAPMNALLSAVENVVAVSPNEESEVVSTHVLVEQNQVDQLRTLAKRTRIAQSEYLREAVDDLLSKYNKRPDGVK